MKIPKIIKLCIGRFHQLDPTYDGLINAVKYTLPGVIGLFIWIYFKKPFSFWIILLPIFSLFPAYLYPTYKGKFYSIGVFLISLAVMQFAVAVLYIHPYILVIVLFILTLLSVSSINYRYSAVLAILCAVIYIELQPGWYFGVNRLIELVVAAFISILLIFIYEYIFSIVKMRLTIIYFLELIQDGFNVFTTAHMDSMEVGIFNKYLFERPLSIRADFDIERMFKSNREKFVHRILMELINKGKFIESEQFFFRKTINYRNNSYQAYILLKRLFRDITFMLRFNLAESKISKLIPTTPSMVRHIGLILSNTCLAFKNDISCSVKFDEKVLIKWNNEYECLKASNEDIEEEILDFIYGIKCMLSDIKELQSILSLNE